VLELALDASDTVGAKNSLEKMLVHQMAVLHRSIMKLTARMDDMQLPMPFPRLGESQERERNQEICRLACTVARLTASYQSGLLVLQRVRSGGRQVVTVQHVHVAEGGQAVVAAKIGGGRGAGQRRQLRGCKEMKNKPDARILLSRLGLANASPRSGARTRRGGSCQGAAMKNGRCRMHGGASTGPRTPEGLERSRKANWKHGRYSAEALTTRREAAAAVR
jgi:hypothetical protein